MITESVTVEKINDLLKFKTLINERIEECGGKPFDIRGISEFSKSLPMTFKVDTDFMIGVDPLENNLPCGDWFVHVAKKYATITKHEVLRWVDYCGKPIPDDDPELLEYIAAKAWRDGLSDEAKHHLDVLQSHCGVVG